MSDRYTEIVILAEDERSANLLRRYVLRSLNLKNRRVRQLISPQARGDAKRWVLDHYPIEVKELRGRHARTGLVVHIDADTDTISRRSEQLAAALTERSQKPRAADERISHAIPRRHTETWLCVLNGVEVDELEDCKRDRVLADFDAVVGPAATALYALTRNNTPPHVLPSLAIVAGELRRLES
jgi:hypothetical protein